MDKSILVSMFAIFAVFALLTIVSANTDNVADLVDIHNIAVTIDGADVSDSSVSGIEAGSVLPIKVVFKAVDSDEDSDVDASDVRVRAEINGYRSDITDRTDRFELVGGSTYTRYLTLSLPSDIDPTEEYTLRIQFSNQDSIDYVDYTISLQRESYNVDVLFVEGPDRTTPGSMISYNVVLKNRGMHKLEDIFVKVSVPELDIEKRVYFGDVNPQDEDEVDEELREANRRDAVERIVYLTVPDNAKSGVYGVEVEAYNVDTIDAVSKSLIISGVEGISNIIIPDTAKTIDIGEEKTYEIVIINSGSKIKVYSLTPGESEGLIVDVSSVTTVPADSSKTVRVRVKATESAEEGTHVVTINVVSEGEVVETIDLTANVEKGSATVTNSVVVLTVILVIVFVVLLIILIVLLTRKPAEVETEETSYY